ncbi:hypothetical protein ACXZ1M_13440 [Duganella sp. PWIR1]
MKLDGLHKLQRELKQAQEAYQGVEAKFSFVATDPTAIETTLAAADRCIDEIVSKYPGNGIIKKMGDQYKVGLRKLILERAQTARVAGEKSMPQGNTISTLLDEIREAILDLQSADYQTASRHFKELARLVRRPELEDLVNSLTTSLDLDAWLALGYATQGGMAGSAILDWPDSSEAELGMTILLIDRFAEDADFPLNFAITFYNAGNSYTSNLRKLVGGVLVPFERKFSRFVQNALPTASPQTQQSYPMNNFVFNNSTVGSVLTGDSSIANVTIHPEQSQYAQLESTLSQLLEGLEKIPALPHHDKGEITELIADTRTELAKVKPSKARLGALLPMIGTAVSVVSDLGGAYSAVQLAANALGYKI